MLTGLQPGISNGTFVKNAYHLEVAAKYDGCHCCVDYPKSTQPMTIVPLVNPAFFGYSVPSEPINSNMGCYKVGPDGRQPW